MCMYVCLLMLVCSRFLPCASDTDGRWWQCAMLLFEGSSIQVRFPAECHKHAHGMPCMMEGVACDGMRWHVWDMMTWDDSMETHLQCR